MITRYIMPIAIAINIACGHHGNDYHYHDDEVMKREKRKMIVIDHGE